MEAEYEMVITKREKNPEYREGARHYGDPEQQRYLGVKELVTTLTEAEFKAVKKSVLEVF